MKRTREQRIMHGLMLLCIAAGFACFALVILPDQLAKAGIVTKAESSKGPANISELVDITDPETRKAKIAHKGGMIARFIPEGAQATNTDQPAYDDIDDFGEVAGAGAAIDGDSYEAHQHEDEAWSGDGLHARADAQNYESDLAIGDPYGDSNPRGYRQAYLDKEPAPEPIKHSISSLTRGDPATIDSQRGRSKKPWLIAPVGYEKDVAFWRDIYAKYDKNNIVLHHPRHLDIVYDVVNLDDIDADPRLNDIERSHMKKRRVDDRRDRIEGSLSVLATNPPSSSLSHEQWRIKKLFSGVTERNKFKRASKDDGVRAQVGQRDKFIIGLAYSGRYLGEIEEIFADYGMPQELTRLIFVESMFNPNAISSAGASGIWQFMPRTGKLYLNISKVADERNDPIKATHAAAKLLRQNYEELGTWPLAINAYNAGRGRLKQAVKQTGSRDIGHIMRNFKHRAYGFASRNFYLEFLAAYEVAEHAERYFGRIEHDAPLEYEIVRSNYHVSLPDVARLIGMQVEELKELNRGFSRHVISGKKLVPRRTEIRVPKTQGSFFLAAAARAPKSRTGSLYHVVARGETLSSIASTYGVTPATIMKYNRHVGRRVTKGQKLVIPAGK